MGDTKNDWKCTYRSANNKYSDHDQVLVHRLICVFVVIIHKEGFLIMWLIQTQPFLFFYRLLLGGRNRFHQRQSLGVGA